MKKPFVFLFQIFLTLAVTASLAGAQQQTASAAPQANLLYVAPGSSCGTLASCYTTIQAAVDAAPPGATIKIAAGTYADLNTLGSGSQVVYLAKSLSLRGGYSPANWSTPNPAANPSVIDPSHLGRGITIDGAAGGTPVAIDGLVIQNGTGNGRGGGIALTSASVNLTNLVVQNNLSGSAAGSGGGIYAANSSLTLTGSQVLGNANQGDPGQTNDSDGGGITVENPDASSHYLLLQNNLIQGNQAVKGSAGSGYGGGLYITSSSTTDVDNNTVPYLSGEISGNTITANGSGLGSKGSGGGVYLDADIRLNANTIQDNTANQAGGGVYLLQASEVKDNLIQNNHTTDPACSTSGLTCGGGGLYSDAGMRAGSIWFNRILNNVSASSGGGVQLMDLDGGFIANTLQGNQAGTMGGGMVLLLSHPGVRLLSNVIAKNSVASGGMGAGIYLREGLNIYTTFDNNTLASNTGGAGIYDENAEVHFNNTIISGHSLGVQFVATSSGSLGALVMNHTLWDANVQNIDSSSQPGSVSDLQPVAGQARFTNPAADDYHLQSSSDAVDHGLDDLIQVYSGMPFFEYEQAEYVDRDGHPRQMGSAPDAGAFEQVYTGDQSFSQALTKKSTIPPGSRAMIHFHAATASGSQAAGAGYLLGKISPSAALSDATPASSDCQVHKDLGGIDLPGYWIVYCAVPPVSPGTDWQSDLNLFTKPDYTGSVTSTASFFPVGLLDSSPGNQAPAPLTFQVEPGPPFGDLWISLAASPYAKPGGPITYTLTWQNSGSIPMDGVTLTDTLADQVSFVNAAKSPTRSGQTLTWSLGSLAPGASGSATVQVNASSTLKDKDSVANTAQISSTSLQENSPETTASGITQIATQPGDVAIEKAASGASGTIYQTVDISGNKVSQWRISLEYLTAFGYRQDPGGPNLPSYQITDPLPAGWNLYAGRYTPAMTFSQNGSSLTWTSQSALRPGQVGWIDLIAQAFNPQAGSSIQNTATILYTTAVGDSGSRSSTATNVVPIFPPLISFPSDGFVCFDPQDKMQVSGGAQPGVTIKVLENGVEMTQGSTDASGKFDVKYGASNMTPDNEVAITAQACFDGNCSAPSRAVRVKESNQFWCPQRSYWRKIVPSSGGAAEEDWNFPFKDGAGQYNASGFQIPGFLGFKDTEIHMYGCCTASKRNYIIIADNVEYHPDHVDDAPDGAKIYVFKIGSAHDVRYKIECDKLQEGSGTVLIDPDGYVYDSAKGISATIPNAKVTAMAWLPEWGGWVPWPASLYNDQVNPQITGPDGYFAFFTPPGFYYIQVEDPQNRFQPWTSPVVQVVNEIVHVNAPLTMQAVSGAYTVQVSPQGLSQPSLIVPVGSTVTWVSTLDTPVMGELLLFNANPILRLLSGLDVLANPLGWDSGRLAPGKSYSRVFTAAGSYPYTDGMGHTGSVIVGRGQAVYLPLARR
jgi:uncharacterized repeat protein (TIGR01451 family)